MNSPIKPVLYSLIFPTTIYLLVLGCKPYAPFPVPNYELNEPALDNPMLSDWIEQGWQIRLDDSTLTSPSVNESVGIVSLAANRPVYELYHADNNERLSISSRHIAFKKVLNFRDLGGIRTMQGRQIQWGKIYRSGKLEKLQREEFEAMKALGIRTVVDLRTIGEVTEEPDKIPPNEGINLIHIPISGITDEDLHKTKKDIKKQSPEEFDGAGKMETVMERFAMQGHQDFAKVFELLLNEENSSIVYHCTAGKDRTGLLTALILSALGVADEVIMQEYLLSNYYRHEKMERNARLGAHILGIETESSRAIMDVRPNYLEASFHAIIEKYGSTEQYLQTAIGLEEQDLAKLRDLYLE